MLKIVRTETAMHVVDELRKIEWIGANVSICTACNGVSPFRFNEGIPEIKTGHLPRCPLGTAINVLGGHVKWSGENMNIHKPLCKGTETESKEQTNEE